MPRVTLVVTDLDNTLWDWVATWYAAFDAMVDAVVLKSGMPREQIEKGMQEVFRKYGTSEYANVIEETRCLLDRHPGENLSEVYAEAIAAKRAARSAVLSLYPGVRETLLALRDHGCKIVAYTESMEFYSMIRIKKLGLDGIIDVLYSPEDHDLAAGYERRHSFVSTIQRYTPAGELKPNKNLLLDIISDQGESPECAVYIGDKLLKDIKMARDAGVRDVFAAYGDAHDSEAYECLRRVTHWTPSEVQGEKDGLSSGEVVPTYVLGESFAELLGLFTFGPGPCTDAEREV